MTTARQLIAAGECTTGCIASPSSPSRCVCPCNRATHGLLADAHLDGLLDGRRRGLRLLSDDELLGLG